MCFSTPSPPLRSSPRPSPPLTSAPPRPPTECPQKIVYWLWILAIFYLEQKIVIKQGVLLQPYEDRVIGNEFLWKTKIPHVVLHVIIDGMTLFNLNALVPQWGVKYPNGPRRAPVLRMSEEAAVAIRHVLKLVLRIPKLNAAILGARAGCHHGYTLIQAMTMSISPTIFGVMLAVESKRWLLCFGLSNVVFMVSTALQLPEAYGYDEDLRRMYLSTEENSPGKLLRIGAPAVFVAPFIVNVIVRNEFVSNYASAYLRLNQRILLGSNRTTKDAGVSLSRLQRSVVFAVGIASIANVNAVHNVFFSSVTRAGVSVETVAAAVTQFLLPCYLTMRHLSFARKRGQGGFLRAAVYARATLTMSFAALSAVFLDICKYTAGTTSDLDVWRVWLHQWLFVVACSHAAVPAPDAARAFAGVLADAAAARGVFLYLAPAGTPEPDQKTQIYALAAMYIAALHLFDVTSFLFETVASRLKVQAEKPSTLARASVASDPLGSYNLPPGHWKMEDYEIDPVKFKLVSKRSARGSEGKGYNLGPMRYREGAPPKDRNLSTVEENEADGVAESAHTQTCRALGCDKIVDTSNSVTAGLKLCSDHLKSQTPFSTTGSQSMFCLSCRFVHSPPRCERCRITRGDHAETLETSFAGRQPGDKPSSPAEFQNVESMTMYFKTNEGPVGAVSRFRRVIVDFGAQIRGSMLHAEVAARPGCTLLTVDVLARPDDDAESFVDGVNRDGDDFDDDGISRSLDAHAADSIDKLRSIGATHGLEGNLAFIVGHPFKGWSRTHRKQFGAGGAARQTTPLTRCRWARCGARPGVFPAAHRGHPQVARSEHAHAGDQVGSLRLHRPAARARGIRVHPEVPRAVRAAPGGRGGGAQSPSRGPRPRDPRGPRDVQDHAQQRRGTRLHRARHARCDGVHGQSRRGPRARGRATLKLCRSRHVHPRLHHPGCHPRVGTQPNDRQVRAARGFSRAIQPRRRPQRAARCAPTARRRLVGLRLQRGLFGRGRG